MTVSIIIPTRNRAAVLKKCLHALVGQLKKGDEVLVVDNGSSDQTKRVILRFQNRLPIKYLFEPRAGPSFARNLGVKKAGGEVIVFLDDDCLVSKNWLSEIRNISQRSNKGTVYQGKINHHFTKENFLSKIFFERLQEEWKKIERTLAWRENRYINFLNSGNFFLKRITLDKLDYVFDPQTFPFIGEERDLAARLQLAGCKIVYLPQITVRHLKQKASIFRSFKAAFYYGRTEGILETKYVVEPSIKKLFKEHLLKESLSFREKTLGTGRKFLSQGLIFYLGIITFLFFREMVYVLGRLYGRTAVHSFPIRDN